MKPFYLVVMNPVQVSWVWRTAIRVAFKWTTRSVLSKMVTLCSRTRTRARPARNRSCYSIQQNIPTRAMIPRDGLWIAYPVGFRVLYSVFRNKTQLFGMKLFGMKLFGSFSFRLLTRVACTREKPILSTRAGRCSLRYTYECLQRS